MKDANLFKIPLSRYCYSTFRAAMKMANMDAILDFMFTNPKNPQGVRLKT